jgi:hypothetical protein
MYILYKYSVIDLLIGNFTTCNINKKSIKIIIRVSAGLNHLLHHHFIFEY